MTKVLHVSGDDYAAMYVSDTFGIDKAVKLAEENGGSYTLDTAEQYAELRVKKFGEVDAEFVAFVKRNIIDYDMSKHEDFFVIEEDE